MMDAMGPVVSARMKRFAVQKENAVFRTVHQNPAVMMVAEEIAENAKMEIFV